jgi:hypothetical protein
MVHSPQKEKYLGPFKRHKKLVKKNNINVLKYFKNYQLEHHCVMGAVVSGLTAQLSNFGKGDDSARIIGNRGDNLQTKNCPFIFNTFGFFLIGFQFTFFPGHHFLKTENMLAEK